MKPINTLSFVMLLFSLATFSSCSSNNVRQPEYHSDIVLDENAHVIDLGLAGQSTDDDQYYYYGAVTLYDEDGGSRDFPCFEGKWGMEKGCRGIIFAEEFYNLDRNKWVIINGIKYRASKN